MEQPQNTIVAFLPSIFLVLLLAIMIYNKLTYNIPFIITYIIANIILSIIFTIWIKTMNKEDMRELGALGMAAPIILIGVLIGSLILGVIDLINLFFFS
jgi:low temperature requirement protein LtrA